MMPSVIPARLQFQCGHAALVTLPRVKGETATQRNDRVAREKKLREYVSVTFVHRPLRWWSRNSQLPNGSHVDFALSDMILPSRPR